MVARYIWLTALVLVGIAYLTRRRWEPRLTRRGIDLRAVPWRWYLAGFPATVIRMRLTWRQTCLLNNLSISPRGNRGLLGGLVVQGSALRQIPPRLGLPRPTRGGLVVKVGLHAGQTPAPFVQAVDALAHAWGVYGVRVTSPARGLVVITVTARDPLTDAEVAETPEPARLLMARVGRIESGGAWLVDFRTVAHWLVVGATTSGKSNWLGALLVALARQPVGLVGIDCKGGLELSLWAPRLSALAINRRQARALLEALVTELESRMSVCRAAGVRNVWELPEDDRPMPLVVIVDEIAELYLSDGSREARDETTACAVLLLRLAQLGAALGVHLVVAGQRFGAELGAGVTALRAQLSGRVAHRVNDPTTAEMALGDLAPDALAAAQMITEEERGVAVTTVGGRWLRARSTHVPTDHAREVAAETAWLRPDFPALASATAEGVEAV
ncbi:FtsK/SpoIIIE domain-containing protein [Streptantibioticus ferralitis]|uniref:FtsK/SpoIIIE domain-containing protein n=1 Tax=Streptantibioticus ferralitis TaxID=236510 RepID=A0ABT5YWY9_9ACTN|nr:FtsK/SpoIIIE domain-containing protein [Streptantibioticus ferralitis]MDF2255360.1 FtsK/SpoIIIE domain-containing protein [Streptantibioticus ferralitis]